MAALNFVASEDGLEESPKLLGLARALKVPRPLAFWYVMRLRRLVLQHGHHITGVLPKQFTDDDVAGFLEFDGKAKVLTAQLKAQGFIGRKKGRQFYYPGWADTITGRYASKREADRLRHAKRTSGDSADFRGASAEASADTLRSSTENQTGRKEERSGTLPPVPPPAGGASLGSERWEWLMKNAPTPQNREVCVRYLATMAPDDWALVQYAYTSRQKGARHISKKNARTLDWATDIWLRKQAWLRFAGYAAALPTVSSEPEKKPALALVESPEDKARTAWEFLRQYLEDDWPEHEKQKRKDAHFKQWGTKPWETPAPPAKKAKAV
jgi:hypothetical protein